MDLEGRNICVLDLETLHSANDCAHCYEAESAHFPRFMSLASDCPGYARIGWENKLALGLSIGCWWDYDNMTLHWFDATTVEQVIRKFVERQPLLVSFNGITFDFALMRALVRHQEAGTTDKGAQAVNRALNAECDAFKQLCAESYDILQEVWKADPARKRERGLNNLDSIAQANGFGAKSLTGAQAPLLWRQGRYAEVIAYNVGDVIKTRDIFEKIIDIGTILRGDGSPLSLSRPLLPASRQAQGALP